MAKQQITFKLLTITPSLATEWLEQSQFDNRRLDDAKVQGIARDIKEGRWNFDGNPIRFDLNGNVIDGQHRLWAIMASGQDVYAGVMHGLAQSTKDTIDTGKPRSVADVLHFNGHKNTSLLATVARMSIGAAAHDNDMWAWSKAASDKRLSTGELLEEVTINARIEAAVNEMWPFKSVRKMIGPGTAVFLFYLLAGRTKQPIEKLRMFFAAVDSGSDLEKDSPVLALRNALLMDGVTMLKNFGGTRASAYKIAITIKAWNAFVKNAPIKSLRFKINTESFPHAL